MVVFTWMKPSCGLCSGAGWWPSHGSSSCPTEWFMMSFLLSALLGQKWRSPAHRIHWSPWGWSCQRLHSLGLLFVLDWEMPLPALWREDVYVKGPVPSTSVSINSAGKLRTALHKFMWRHLFVIGGGWVPEGFGVLSVYLTLWFQLGHHVTKLSFLLP